MHWIDWCITVIPVVIILGLGFYSRKYVRGVVDFLVAGRVAGRYVIAVGDLQAGLSIITLVATTEAACQTGFSVGFWGTLFAPIGIVLGLTGFCTYRFRETKAMSFGQFLEMRYNRTFRIFAATLRTISEMVTNAIGPAIAANFFIYFLNLPHRIYIFNMPIPCFALVVGGVLIMAMVVIWPAGRISLLITDCFQGIMGYPIFVMMIGYVLVTFSWFDEMAPVLMDRVPGQSFLNPFDIAELRDFNIFASIVMIVGSVLNRASWFGNDTSGCARTPHEQKMAGVLGYWRNGFAFTMCTFISAIVITVSVSDRFADKAHDIRQQLSVHVTDEVFGNNPAVKNQIDKKISQLPVQHHRIGVDAPMSQEHNGNTIYFDTVKSSLGDSGKANYDFQQYRTLFQQMIMPITLRNMLPVGLIGVFCLLMVMLMLSTDDGRIFNASSTIVQDVILPFFKGGLSPQKHIMMLRLASAAVAVFFFVVAMFFAQLDYINMFITVMTAVWLGGAGPVMIFGLYSRFGNTAGAFSSIFVGSGMSVAGLAFQRNWAQHVYPFLEQYGLVEPIGSFLETVSGPFNPYIVWKMDEVKFPINSYEVYFLSMFAGLAAYIIGSLITYRRPYNLDRLLHRGAYAIDGEKRIKSAWTIRSLWGKLIGITPEYTRGDRVIAWMVFGYSVVWTIGIWFGGITIWNLIQPWPDIWWSYATFFSWFILSMVIGIVSTFWFLIGGVIDLRRLFKDLADRVDNPLDDGRVSGQVSLADLAIFEKEKLDVSSSEDDDEKSSEDK